MKPWPEHNPNSRSFALYVFDLLFLNGKTLLKQPLSQRRSHLPQILAGTCVLFSSPLNGTPAVLMKAVPKHNLEGIVAKRKDSLQDITKERVALTDPLPHSHRRHTKNYRRLPTRSGQP